MVLLRRVVPLLVLALSGCDQVVMLGDGGTGGGAATGGGGGTTGGGGGTTGGGGGNTGGGSGLEPFICSASKPCPSGQFCFNGLCALGCQTNANCAADQYCDTEFDHLCHNKTVPTCAVSTECASSQVCISGFCSTPPPVTQCDPNQVASGNDGCDQNSLCVDPSETQAADPKCYTFPACAQDKTCPVGLQGAVCNDGLIPNKARVCLTGLCRSAANCPSSWTCVKFNSADVLGVCSNRGFGSPCTGPGECQSGNCVMGLPGLPGICQ